MQNKFIRLIAINGFCATIRIKFSSLLHQLWQAVVTHCPFGARKIATLKGILKYALFMDRRENLAANLRAAFPVKSSHEIGRICRDIFVTTERNSVDQFRLELLNEFQMRSALARIELLGQDHIEKAYQEGRAVILVTPHYGNFMLGALRVAADYAKNGVYFFYNPPDRNTYAEKSNQLLERPANNCHKIYNNSYGIKTALKVLKARGTLCMMPDLVSDLAAAIYVPFFGRFFTAMSGIAFLALRSNAVIIPVYCCSRKAGDSVLEFRAPLTLAGTAEQSDADRVYELTCLLFSELEREITLHPAHWRYWHVYLKRSIAFPLPPTSASDLRAQLSNAADIVSSDQSLAEIVKHWVELLDRPEAVESKPT